jgi:release factor glutamine methyltransferase
VKVKSNKVKDIRDYYIGKLEEIYPVREAGALLDILLEDLLGITKTQRMANQDLRISESEILTIHFAAKSLLTQVPVQQITGIAWFYNLRLMINPSVLIPRPETEELVDWIFNDHKNTEQLKILDIGTGSGAIAIAIKQNLKHAAVSACDVSLAALETAKKNATNYGLEINFSYLDILDENRWSQWDGMDVIVSNPPYIRPSEKKIMKANVLDHEPEIALFVPEHDPLIFYKKIAAFGQQKLNPGGSLYFEINEQFGNEIIALLQNSGYKNVVLRQDLNEKDRMIRAHLQ